MSRLLTRFGALSGVLLVFGAIMIVMTGKVVKAAPSLVGDGAPLVPTAGASGSWSMILANAAVVLLGVSWVVLMRRQRR